LFFLGFFCCRCKTFFASRHGFSRVKHGPGACKKSLQSRHSCLLVAQLSSFASGDWPPSRREGGKVAPTRRLESLRYSSDCVQPFVAPKFDVRRWMLNVECSMFSTA